MYVCIDFEQVVGIGEVVVGGDYQLCLQVVVIGQGDRGVLGVGVDGGYVGLVEYFDFGLVLYCLLCGVLDQMIGYQLVQVVFVFVVCCCEGQCEW